MADPQINSINAKIASDQASIAKSQSWLNDPTSSPEKIAAATANIAAKQEVIANRQAELAALSTPATATPPEVTTPASASAPNVATPIATPAQVATAADVPPASPINNPSAYVAPSTLSRAADSQAYNAEQANGNVPGTYSNNPSAYTAAPEEALTAPATVASTPNFSRAADSQAAYEAMPNNGVPGTYGNNPSSYVAPDATALQAPAIPAGLDYGIAGSANDGNLGEAEAAMAMGSAAPSAIAASFNQAKDSQLANLSLPMDTSDALSRSMSRPMSGGLPSTSAAPAAAATWTGDAKDWRVKVSLASGAKFFYKDEDNKLLAPIKSTNGVIFPITPQVQMAHTAKYSSTTLTHSNYAMQFYEGSEIAAININAEFPIQNIEEGQYLLAAIVFFRSATKMFWGSDGSAGFGTVPAGSPPPMLYVTGYGHHYFPNVPCVLTSFSHTMPDGVDYIEVPTPGDPKTTTRLPTQSTVQVVLQPIYSRSSVTKFTLTDFAKGLGVSTGKSKGFV